MNININKLIEEEEGACKYYKKKKVVKPHTKKSKHKHIYEKCLLINKSKNEVYVANYCTICGKIGKINFFETEEVENEHKFKHILNNNEIIAKYKDQLRIFYIKENITEIKYVKIDKQ